MLTLIAFALLVFFSNASRVGRIIGGKVASENVAPFMAEIQTKCGSRFNHKCGGAVIHAFFVLTAGNCLQGTEPKNVRVLVGTNDIEIDKLQSFYKVDKFVVHSR